jgi:hypothetical protein
VDARAQSAERTAETATSPIAGYDEMNVEEISERLDVLTDEQVRQRVRDYEWSNQNRKTLISRSPYPGTSWKRNPRKSTMKPAWIRS